MIEVAIARYLMSGRMSEANTASLLRCIVPLLILLGVSGCATLGYYGHAIGGHYSILGRARPIDEWLSSSSTDPALKQKLQQVVAIRDFASRALGLPDNNSYRNYADLERPYAVWNVVAAPELSLKPKESCFLMVGCVAYRGYFTREDAEREAQRLREDGYDVLVGGVTAYSTLGWFDDPLLNTMLTRPEPELAGLLFHELAHQRVYARNDTAFNESFAMTVEREGVRRWLAAHDATSEYQAFIARAQRQEQFVALILDYRERLDRLYRSSLDDDGKRAGKRDLLASLRREYAALKHRWGDYGGYDKWIENVNNAGFISIGLYHQYVPALQALLERHAGDLPAFYRAVEKLAHESPAQRTQQLQALASAGRRAEVRP
jgi:predicted aminopeptidase